MPAAPAADDGHWAFNPDTPITSKIHDRFNRSKFAVRIAETLAKRRDATSLVIGLYGAWGDGKTSVLEMMSEALESEPDIVTIRFNPWHFQSEETLIKAFFSTLATALGRSLPNLKEKIGEMLSSYGSVLSLASLTFAEIVSINPGDAAKGLGEALSTVDLDELRKRIDAILEKSGKKVVVLIDDIDRLDRSETYAVFKLVKLSAGFRHTSYVLAFDDAVVSAALGERYGQGGADAGRAFLEKIVQVPLHLPPADPISLRQLVFEGIEEALNQAEIELTQEMVDTFVRHFVDGLEHRLSTPRLAKLYANAAAFVLPLMKGEVHVVDMLLVEGLRILYPNLYTAIRDNPEVFLKRDENAGRRIFNGQEKTALEQLLESSMRGATDGERIRVRRGLLEQIFPRLKNTIYGPEWDRIWARKRRICTEEYFKRYFSYGIPVGDISDLEVDALLEKLPHVDDAAQTTLLNSFAERRSVPRLVSMLRDRTEDLSEQQANAMVQALARNASVLPVERGPYEFGGTRMQAAILVSKLLHRIPTEGARQHTAEGVIAVADPVAFAFECLRFVCHHPDRHEEERILTDEGDRNVRAALANRLQRINAETPLYVTAPKDAPQLFWAITSELGHEALSQSLQARFAANPVEVDQFLNCFVGEGWYLETGLPVRSDFDRRCYDNVVQLVPPSTIKANLRARYDVEIAEPSYQYTDDTPIATRIAHQFLRLYQQMSTLDSTAENPNNTPA